MSTKGLRISDLKNAKCVPLSEILASIPHANQYSWVLLWVDATPNKNEGKVLKEWQEKTNKSEQGFPCSFEMLMDLSNKMFQEIEILIVGSKSKSNLHRYKKDQEMYETCDFVIEMIDGGFWEIFSKDFSWIAKLQKKYKEVEPLNPEQ